VGALQQRRPCEASCNMLHHVVACSCCSMLQRVAACCSMLQHAAINLTSAPRLHCTHENTRRCNTLQHATPRCNTNTLQRDAICCNSPHTGASVAVHPRTHTTMQHTSQMCRVPTNQTAKVHYPRNATTCCNTLQHTATHLTGVPLLQCAHKPGRSNGTLPA